MAKATKKHTPKPASAPQGERMSGSASQIDELVNLWLSAIGEFPNTKPLADLFRTSTPPPNVGGLLAEYLDPSDPDICGFRLVCERTKGIDQANELMELTYDHYTLTEQLTEAGKPSPSVLAARFIGAVYSIDHRTVFRRIKHWREMASKIALSLRGAR